MTPDGAAVSRLPSNGVQYSQPFTITNSGSAQESFTLTAAVQGSTAVVVSTNGQAGTAGGTVTLASGASATVTLVYTVSTVAATGDVDRLRLTATSTTRGTVSDPGDLTITVIRAGLTIVKQLYRDDRTTALTASSRVVPGEYVQYRITVTGAGGAEAVAVRVADPLPSDLVYSANTPDAAGWTIGVTNGTLTASLAGMLANGQSRFFWLRVRVR